MAVKTTIIQALLGQFLKMQAYAASYKSQECCANLGTPGCWRTYPMQEFQVLKLLLSKRTSAVVTRGYANTDQRFRTSSLPRGSSMARRTSCMGHPSLWCQTGYAERCYQALPPGRLKAMREPLWAVGNIGGHPDGR